MRLIYPAVFHPQDVGFWVEFPDMPGCATEGDTLDQAMAMAAEAAVGYTSAALDLKKALPPASDIRDVKTDGGFASYVTFDLDPFLGRNETVNKTVTLPKWLNEAATERRLNFSQALREALIRQL